ncbi:RHS repeat-associated core domain-containing protein [Arachidicoccus rhizosphaerae]|uniref:RHS repeat-associated core domain-containing protein n=1 Tax=Arachidicoccus rhizosphaerae TaxID=551991 RepID=A0A1H3VL42_9BACT|nr:FG-GAP-like repeat-containing protein [Arachidicoccus rhizosphaerae]SDZ75506.1 RHS repeat-associated core domain-containing protein [Arachidicoccus rhizosphaerae]
MPVIAGDGKFNYVGKTYILPGDFDGDGYQDYILILGKGDIYHYKAFFCSPHKNLYNIEVSGLGIQTNTLYQYEYYASSIINCQVRPVDIDGDGKTDLMVSNNEGTHFIKINNVGTSTAYVLEATESFSSSVINGTLPIYSGDFNGDGITDFLVRSTPETGNNSSAQHTGMYGPWNIFYGSPSSLIAQTFYFKYAPALKGDGYSNTHLLMVSDLNKDGRSDIWQSLDFIDGTTGVLKSRHIAYYKTDGVNSEDGLNGFISQTDTTATSINSDVNKEPVFGDFNGDGKTDMMTIQGSSVRFIYPIPERESQMLAQVTNGLGSKTKITYDRINKEVVYTKTTGEGSNSLFPSFESALYVASKITTSNGIGGEASTSYHYSDATFNPTRGFLGFHQQNTQNEATGINSFTVVKFNPNFLRPTISFRYTLNQTNDTISKQIISDSLVAMSTDPGNRRFTYQINKIIGYDGISGAATQVVNTYDAFGNITKAVTTKGSLTNGVLTGAVEIKTVSTAYGIHNTPVAAFPNSITYSNTRSGQAAVTKLSTYSYDSKGNTLVVTHYAGTAKAVTTTYSYSNTGNETKIVQASTGLSSRTLEKFYDPQGRFLIQTKQTGSGITKNAYFTYDDGGNLLSDKNSAGLTTTYLYTGFNNLKKKTLPEGYSIDIAYSWETASGKRFSISQTRPGGGRDIKIWYDDLGRAVAKQTSGYNNKNATQEFTYDAKGQLISSTAPHYSTETAVTTNYFYDNVSRLTKVSNAKNYTSFAFAKQTGGKYKVTTTKSSGQSSYIITDATGQIVNASDNGGLLSYSYDSWGNRIKTMMGGKALITNSYDSYGRLAAITELNSGTFNYSYDAFNQLISQSDPLGHSYTINYDDFGRVSSRVGPEGTTSYSYYNNAANGYNDDHIAKVIGFYGEETDFTYDEKMRLNSKKIIVDGSNYMTTFTNDLYGNVVKEALPDGLVINKTYDHNGSLTATDLQDGSTGVAKNVFTATNINGAGAYTGYTLGNGKTSQITYDMTLGKPTRYYTAGIQDLNFVFDNNTGNLTSRKDAIYNLTETFSYDNLNRLTGNKVNNVQQQLINYDNTGGVSFGNIVQKSDAGKYVYNTTKINAVAYITDTGTNGTLPPPNISTGEQKIGYTPFLMTDSISENGIVVRYKYGFGYSRIKSVKTVNGSIQETRYYFNDFEKQIKGSTSRYIHYLHNGKQLYAIAVKEGSAPVKVYYTYTDYLGSILAVTDSTGAVIARQNFDPWGRHRNATNWSYNNIASVPDWLYRGFTGHEELPEFGVINMNGRMYDPVQGRMLAPDKLVSNILSSQAYNRFSYALNNPLIYVDPSGFLAQQTDGDYWNGGYNGGDANILPDVIIGSGSGSTTDNPTELPINLDPGNPFYGYNPPTTGPGSGGGGSGGGASGGSSRSGDPNSHKIYNSEVVKVDTYDNIKADNDIEATGKEAPIIQVSDLVDKSMTATDASLQGAQKIANTVSKTEGAITTLEDIPVLSAVGKVAAGVVAGHKIYMGATDFKNHWFDLAEGVGYVTLAIAAPEILLGYSITTTIIDFFR